jgi:subtilase family serine protease
LLAVTNDDGNHQQETNDSNNVKVIATLDLPDLVVSNAQVKNAPTWGETIPVTWTVTNQGPSVALGRWYDGFYLSNDPVLDSSDVAIASRYTSATDTSLAAGGSYTVSQNITLPTNHIDKPYLLAVTDYSDNNQQETNDSNNFKVIAKLERSPDLVVSSALVKDTPTWGETIPVTWTVTNQGSDTASARWSDGFYLSSDATLDSSDIFITSRQVSTTESPLAPGGSYTATQNIILPNSYTDKPYLLAVTD